MTDPHEVRIADWFTTFQNRGLWSRLNDWLFGYDYFISYRWSDGRAYAVSLAEKLKELDFECFLDSEEFLKGDNLVAAGERALKKTTRLVLVGSPEAHQSSAIRRELRVFRATGKMIVPIDFDGSLANSSDHALEALINEIEEHTLCIREPLHQLSVGPSPETIDALKTSFQVERQRQLRSRMVALFSGLLLILFLAASTAFGAIAFGLPRYRIASSKDALESLGLAVNEDKNGGLVVARKENAEVTDWSRVGAELKVLDSYGALVEIDLYGVVVPDLKPLADLKKLKTLKLQGTRVAADSWSDLSPLAGMTELSLLVFEFCDNLTDDQLRHVGELTSLRALNVGFCENITDTGLGHLSGLRLSEFSVEGCPKVSQQGLLALDGSQMERINVQGTAISASEELIAYLRKCERLTSFAIDRVAGDEVAIEKLRILSRERGFTVHE